MKRFGKCYGTGKLIQIIGHKNARNPIHRNKIAKNINGAIGAAIDASDCIFYDSIVSCNSIR